MEIPDERATLKITIELPNIGTPELRMMHLLDEVMVHYNGLAPTTKDRVMLWFIDKYGPLDKKNS